MPKYLHNLLIAVDQFFNALFGGDPDETVSARLGRMSQEGSRIAKLACRFLALFDEHHCKESLEAEQRCRE